VSGTSLRRLGVYGDNLPVKRETTVTASDFLIGGIMGRFERKFNASFKVGNMEDFQAIFGKHVISTYYGYDAVQGFFDNVVGVDATLYVASYLGNVDGTIDAVSASRTVSDSGGNESLEITDGYETEVGYGISGNRTSVQLTAATRFSTAAAAAVPATGQEYAELDSVVGIYEGDIITFSCSGGTASTIYKKVTEIDESNKYVYWDGDLSDDSTTLAEDDTVSVEGFTIQVYRKSISGVETEVETDLGRVVCTMESEVTDYYAPNVHDSNKWIVVEDLSSESELGERAFSDDSLPVYMTGGDDGTAPSGSSSWDNTLSLFDDDPVRILTNPETTLKAVHSAGETYCKSRQDTPIWLAVISEDQTKSQIITWGNNYQRSDEVNMVVVANWLEIEDPFANSSLAPNREVPNVGHVMGCWVRSIGTNGIHYVPAVKTMPLYGVKDIVGEQFLDDYDRTDIAEAGVNLIQDLTGIGIVIRNFFTPSTDVAYQFANGPMMRNYIKVSAVDSLQSSENTPNSLKNVKEDKMACLQFLYKLWNNGSNGSVPTGETFGQSEDSDGVETTPEDHFDVKADLINNPQSDLNVGERNVDIWFTYPTPAGSIKIGVGIWLRS
jgi:hypothetical protein